MVELRPHEQDAITQMVSYLRATAGVLGDGELTRKMHAWSEIVDEFLERAANPEPPRKDL